MKTQWGDFAELTTGRKSWCSIMTRLQDNMTPEETKSNDNKYYFVSHQRRIYRETPVACGPQHELKGLLIDVRDYSDKAHLDRLEKHLYLGSPHKIYSFSIRFANADRASIEADLATIISTMKLD
jgi:hypothetical protein